MLNEKEERERKRLKGEHLYHCYCGASLPTKDLFKHLSSDIHINYSYKQNEYNKPKST